VIAGRDGLTDVLIEPTHGWPRLRLGDLWHNLGVVGILAVREITIRYKQRIVGIGWALLQPLLTAILCHVLFQRIVSLPAGRIPYGLVALCALVPWTYFSHATTKAAICLVTSSELVSKVYFPRLAFPLASVLAALVDFAVAFGLLLGALAVYAVAPPAAVVFLPLFLLLCVGTVLGLGLWLSAINVQYRDVSNALPFLMQIMLFVTPVAYPTAMVPERWRLAYALNPMATVIDGFRWCLLGEEYAPGPRALVSVGVTVVTLVGGLYFFRYREDRFADLV
jgi:lipopolysaccharide transport system permease protein